MRRVEDRPRATILVTPSLTLLEEYDDNVFLSSDARSDFVRRLDRGSPPFEVDPEMELITGRFFSTWGYSFTTFRSDAPMFRDRETHEAEGVRRSLISANRASNDF